MESSHGDPVQWNRAEARRFDRGPTARRSLFVGLIRCNSARTRNVLSRDRPGGCGANPTTAPTGRAASGSMEQAEPSGSLRRRPPVRPERVVAFPRTSLGAPNRGKRVFHKRRLLRGRRPRKPPRRHYKPLPWLHLRLPGTMRQPGQGPDPGSLSPGSRFLWHHEEVGGSMIRLPEEPARGPYGIASLASHEVGGTSDSLERNMIRVSEAFPLFG